MLHLNNYFVKERVGFMKLVDVYDIFDPESGAQVGIAVERPSMPWLRLLVNKKLLPTRVDIAPNENDPPMVSISRGFTLLRAKIDVLGSDGEQLGYFKAKIFSLGGGFWVYNNQDEQVAEVKGDWKGFNFKFLSSSGEELGTITKKWSGIGKEMFTSADNYIISLNGDPNAAANALLLAAGIAIDTIFKESN